MNKNILKIAFVMVLGAAMSLTSCNKEPDESNLYTFTGKTIQDYLQENDSIFHQFNIILQRSGYDRMMASYGQYTCYAPINSGVDKYIDSLYNDPEAKVKNNGLTENSVYGLSEEQCKEIAQFHLSSVKKSFVEDLSKASGAEVYTMLNITFKSTLDNDGVVRFNDVAEVMTSVEDNALTNGNVHVINNVIPRSNRLIAETLEKHTEFSIFYEALEKCGLLDVLAVDRKTNADGSDKEYSVENTGRPGTSWVNNHFYYPKTCKVNFTIFAEDNATFNAAGIYNFEDLKAKCIEWYGNAAQWYDYADKANNPISIGDDYTYTYNVVNMFVRYHIIKAGMPVSKLVYSYDRSNQDWNYAFGGEPYDYYETMLPNTMMKIWQPLYQPTGATQNIWINRWRALNTLTDEIGTFGSDAMHNIERTGCLVVRSKSDIKAYNGYIHTINAPLIYDADVPNGVLHERIRIDMGTMLYELINNDLRLAKPSDIDQLALNNGITIQSNDKSRLPLDYFDNLVSYNDKTALAWYTQGAWRAWEADQLSGWGENDFAFRLPPVPSGTYEIRVIYPPMDAGGIQQYYYGTSSDPSSMQPLGIPFDARYPNSGVEADRAATGYLLSDEFTDYGVASDLVMRTHGYMRAPASFSRGNGDGKGRSNPIYRRVDNVEELLSDLINCCRYEEGYGTSMMRKILGTVTLDQSNNYWIRLKNCLKGGSTLGFSVDFIELVPLDIVNSQDYTEDWY